MVLGAEEADGEETMEDGWNRNDSPAYTGWLK